VDAIVLGLNHVSFNWDRSDSSAQRYLTGVFLPESEQTNQKPLSVLRAFAVQKKRGSTEKATNLIT